ncbi:MAG: ABC transporter substrate-binding protein [Prochlorothrix sp.]|nr:ABC transporter substrate-binding protein [Prochlorothrix sp.]
MSQAQPQAHTTFQFQRYARRRFLQIAAAIVASGLLVACGGSSPDAAAPVAEGDENTRLQAVTLGTNWYAQAEHGGFYQAVAEGIYESYGLDVTIAMGGPQINGTQLLMGGSVDFFMGQGADAVQAVIENIPKVTVAAIFQKDPQIIMAHPNQGVETLADLQGKPIYISSAANLTFWPLLKMQYGFEDSQKRPYNFTVAPFLVEESSAQQGYLSSEPFMVRNEGGFDPLVFLLADTAGYSPYATTIETRRDLVDTDPDLVQRFVTASIEGWYSYLNNPTPANLLIQAANPQMTDEQLAYSYAKMQEYGLVTSGDAETLGIGAMTDDRWQSFFQSMVAAGVYPATTDVTQAYTLEFVNQGAATP